jgi:hypothetical protein
LVVLATLTAGIVSQHQQWPPGMSVWWRVLQIFAIQLQPEDIIIAGTDGLFDNVFPEESAALMRYRFHRVDGQLPWCEISNCFGSTQAGGLSMPGLS